MMLPNLLFRGDDDSDNARKLRATIDHGQLNTNLLNGGEGSKIFTSDLMTLVNAHILSRFDASHFLSFTSEIQSAYRFGLKLSVISEEIIEECCDEIYDTMPWGFALITFDTGRFKSVTCIHQGVYECTFWPTLLEFTRHGVPYTLFLINPVEALGDNYVTAREYSDYDKEWLILPATRKEFNFGITEFSGILDGACISHVQRFVINQGQREKYNTISYG